VPDFEIVETVSGGRDDDKCTQWSGGVNNEQSDQEDVPTLDMSDILDSDNDLEELVGKALMEGLEKEWAPIENEAQSSRKLSESFISTLIQPRNKKDWEKAEMNQQLGYNGLSKRRQREIAQGRREKEEQDKIMCERCDVFCFLHWLMNNYVDIDIVSQ